MTSMASGRVVAVICALVLGGASLPASAETVSFNATLSGPQEVPPNDSQGTGTVEATYDTDTMAFEWTITYSGLTSEPTAAHFHGPATAEENAPPVVPIEGSLASPISGSTTLTEAQAVDLQAGLWYFNLHTAQYPDGELRGQLTQQ